MNILRKEIRWIRLLLTVIALPIIVIILKELKSIFIPLIFAIFLSFVFAPLITFLTKKKVPMGIIIVLMFVIILMFFALVGGIFYAAFDSFMAEFPIYQQKLTALTEQTLAYLQNIANRVDIALSGLFKLDATNLFAGSDFSLTRMISGTMGSFVDFGVNLFLTMFFLMFIVAGTGKLEHRVQKVLTEDHKQRTLSTITNIQSQIQKYLFNKTLISLGTAVTGMLFMLIFRVDFVIITGIMLFTLNFIPNIGSIIASSFPIMISLLSYGFGWRSVGMMITIIMTQMVWANIIEPKLMGERLNLTPIMVLISLVFWGWVWGIVGMVVAVPITSAINIIIKQLDEDNIISAVISGS